ncbi:hypothetical protein DIJ64_01400 [Mycobacterium leprae]|uniref:Uncharacterized protein n=1 Tax=Mycobacterium leprae TaxID=1769 RepID=A0AAD0P7Q9_MYCLR|nr:hypothetical protein DIJ64_01400 [Mycobacterium leprae]OAR21383.1 hypothetical protein A8144_06160 [Mycobacterium leprae 3125609]
MAYPYFSHQTTICLGMTMGLNPYRGPAYALAPLAVAVIPSLLEHPGDRFGLVGYDPATAL